jgi:predicted methyltransferase
MRAPTEILRKAWAAGMLATAALLASASVLAEQSVAPAINRHYESADYQQWVSTFERAGREVYDKRAEIVTAVQVKPGMAVADVGAGTGLFTRLFAREVGPKGRVYAVDITPEFVTNTVRTAREQQLANVEGVVNTPTDTRLAPQSVDVAFLCDTYHHFEYPQSMLASLHRALRPGGRLVVIDYEKIDGRSSAWVMDHVRAEKAAVIREIEAAGFRFLGEERMLKENYFLRFART